MADEGAATESDADIRLQLAEALATIDAIRNGEVDAVVVGGEDGQRVFTLDNVDRPYRVIIEEMQEGAVTMASDGLILYCNRRFSALAGLQGTSLVGSQFAELVEDTAGLTQLLHDGGAGEFALRSDGPAIPINLSVVKLSGPAETELRCAIVTDLSVVKARQAEIMAAHDQLGSEIEERRRAEDGLLFALDSAEMGSWDLDVVSGQARRSRRHDEIFGYPDGAASWGLNSALEHFIDEDRPLVAAAFSEAETTGEVDFQYRIKRANDGAERWLHMRGQTVTDNGVPIRIAGVVSDVTESRLLDEQIRQVQKMDAVGQLSGGIAHDFNNLLTIVIGNLEMADRALNSKDEARIRRAVVNALKGAERAAVLTQRLLAFSRRTPLAPKFIDIARIVDGMIELLDRSLGENVELETWTSERVWAVEADPNQLENAVLNLAVNARDAMPQGGKLAIEVRNATVANGDEAALDGVPLGEYVTLAVKDTGTGMPPDVVAKAFDPFFTTKEVGKGTGLGLSQVYGYVKQSGGHVRIDSKTDCGTTICIYLPRAFGGTAHRARPKDINLARGSGIETILVVEDDEDVRNYTATSLSELGYNVIEAEDGASALKALEHQQAPVSLLFTDVVMPGMSGRELMEVACRRYPDLKVLFTSGYARSAIVHGGRLDADVELLAKPFSFGDLAAKVREVIDK